MTHPFLILSSIILFLSSYSINAFEEEGLASWYGGHFQGRKTANGEIFDTYQISAAHKSLPFGTMVTVYNLENGKKLEVRINDRGPYIDHRIIDLSYAAAKELGILNQGVAKVRITANAEAIELSNLVVIQVGAFKNIVYAKKMKETLVKAGLNPYAIMTNSGLVRIELKNIHKNDTNRIIKELKDLGFNNSLIKTV